MKTKIRTILTTGIMGFLLSPMSQLDAQTSPFVPNGMKEFIASGNFVVPTGITRILVQLWGAGGGGAHAPDSPTHRMGGAGGYGAYSSSVLTVTPGVTLAITIGVGGPIGGLNGQGGNGGDSAIGVRHATPMLTSGGGRGGGGDGIDDNIYLLGNPGVPDSRAQIGRGLNVLPQSFFYNYDPYNPVTSRFLPFYRDVAPIGAFGGSGGVDCDNPDICGGDLPAQPGGNGYAFIQW